MAMALGGRGTVSPEINVTSLIDVLLVLLIIFMVLPPSAGEAVEIPQKTATTMRPPEKPMIIQLKQASAGQRPALKINDEEVSWENLEGRLHKLYIQRMDKAAFVKGDPEIDFQYVAEVIDVTHHAGAGQVGLLGPND